LVELNVYVVGDAEPGEGIYLLGPSAASDFGFLGKGNWEVGENDALEMGLFNFTGG